MRICRLDINGFRGIKEGSVTFPEHALLLGPNNCGKTTVAEALALLFGRERAVTRQLSDWDFFGGTPKADTRFTLIGTVTDFGDGTVTDPGQFPDWFCGERGATPVWFREDTGEVLYAPDPPLGTKLAAQIALTGRYDEDACEFETVRYYYQGPCDPFTDPHFAVPLLRQREMGVFVLPCNREWQDALSFNSSTFLKVLREYGAVPGKSIDDLKQELRSPDAKIEDATPFTDIIQLAEQELRGFSFLAQTDKLAYRPTQLDSLAVMRSLVPHIMGDVIEYLPVARQGSGLISLQTFLLLLAFADYNRRKGRNFVFIAEEPELHLHPSLHRRLATRIRGLSTQSIITTHSPNIAAGYQPH